MEAGDWIALGLGLVTLLQAALAGAFWRLWSRIREAERMAKDAIDKMKKDEQEEREKLETRAKEARGELAHRQDRLSTKVDTIENRHTRAQLATEKALSDIRERMATRDDMSELRQSMDQAIQLLKRNGS